MIFLVLAFFVVGATAPDKAEPQNLPPRETSTGLERVKQKDMIVWEETRKVCATEEDGKTIVRSCK